MVDTHRNGQCISLWEVVTSRIVEFPWDRLFDIFPVHKNALSRFKTRETKTFNIINYLYKTYILDIKETVSRDFRPVFFS
jgi:hypothetical protein